MLNTKQIFLQTEVTGPITEENGIYIYLPTAIGLMPGGSVYIK
jgi:hypothetical protein